MEGLRKGEGKEGEGRGVGRRAVRDVFNGRDEELVEVVEVGLVRRWRVEEGREEGRGTEGVTERKVARRGGSPSRADR